MFRRTKSRIDGRLGAAGFSDHDRGVGIVFLHRGIASSQEVSTQVSHRFPLIMSFPMFRIASVTSEAQSVIGRRIPYWCAVLASLAEQEPQLLEPRGKRIF
jgi:hypothetical protein